MLGTIRTAQDSFEDVRAAAEEVVRGTRSERGCIHYAISPDPTETATLLVAEQWEDEETHAAHLDGPWVQKLRAALGSADGVQVDMRRLVVTE